MYSLIYKSYRFFLILITGITIKFYNAFKEITFEQFLSYFKQKGWLYLKVSFISSLLFFIVVVYWVSPILLLEDPSKINHDINFFKYYQLWDTEFPKVFSAIKAEPIHEYFILAFTIIKGVITINTIFNLLILILALLYKVNTNEKEVKPHLIIFIYYFFIVSSWGLLHIFCETIIILIKELFS